MLDFDMAIELMKKYGYSSTTTHPYLYQNGDSLGICYRYYDEEYGWLERIKVLEDKDSFELFLQKLEWVKNNAKNYHVRMILDNYESINPKVMFLRKEKIMVEGEMFDIDNFDYRESQRSQMDEVSQLIYEAGDLLLIYDEIKGRQLQYLKSLVALKNVLRTKYYELQKEVDTYNKYKIERHLTLLPDVTDIGINDTMEIATKDRYNLYISQRPSYEEAAEFLKEVWELNKNLELNIKYYEAQKEENDIRNEIKVVDRKLDLMKKLNDNLKPLFGIDLVSRFRKINRICKQESNTISEDIIQNNIDRINRKYEVYDSLDYLYTSDYLREAIQNTNYADLAIKYSKNNPFRSMDVGRKAPNEVAASLSVQYRDKLSVSEQAILVLYNNHKYRKLCNAILDIEGFESLPVKKVVSKISGIKGFSKIKTECYDVVKKRINDPVNQSIKNSLFSTYDFTSFETFVTSLISDLVKLKEINNKMILNGDINMFMVVNKVEDINKKKFVMVTNDIETLLNETKGTSSMIAITLLKTSAPVLYSPYYLDIGDIYSRDASPQMFIKEMINFELLVDISDVVINIDPVKTNVVRYYSEPIVIDNYSVVDDIKMSYKTTFCKYAFTNGLGGEIPDINSLNVAVPENVANTPAVADNNSGDNPELAIFNNPFVAEDVPAVGTEAMSQPVTVESTNQSVPVEASNLNAESVTPVANVPESIPTINVEQVAQVASEVNNVQNEADSTPANVVLESNTDTTGDNNVDNNGVINNQNDLVAPKLEENIEVNSTPEEVQLEKQHDVQPIVQEEKKEDLPKIADDNNDSEKVLPIESKEIEPKAEMPTIKEDVDKKEKVVDVKPATESIKQDETKASVVAPKPAVPVKPVQQVKTSQPAQGVKVGQQMKVAQPIKTAQPVKVGQPNKQPQTIKVGQPGQPKVITNNKIGQPVKVAHPVGQPVNKVVKPQPVGTVNKVHVGMPNTTKKVVVGQNQVNKNMKIVSNKAPQATVNNQNNKI